MVKALFAEEVMQTDCCGLYEISGLEVAKIEEPNPHGADYQWNVRYHYKENTLREMMKDFAAGGGARGGRGFYATTISDMREEIRELKRLGFKKVAKWKNNNTGNYITMWFRVQKGKK